MKSASERHLSLAPAMNAEASRSNAEPSVERTSQPRPRRILVMLGAAFLSERFSPFLSVIAMCTFSCAVLGLGGRRDRHAPMQDWPLQRTERVDRCASNLLEAVHPKHNNTRTS